MNDRHIKQSPMLTLPSLGGGSHSTLLRKPPASAPPPSGTQEEGTSEAFTTNQVGCMCIPVWYNVGSSSYGAFFFTNNDWSSYSTLWFGNPEGMGNGSPYWTHDHVYWAAYFSPKIKINLSSGSGVSNATGITNSNSRFGGMVKTGSNISLFGGAYGSTAQYTNGVTDVTTTSQFNNSASFSGSASGANQGTSGVQYKDGMANYNGNIYICGSFGSNYDVCYKSTDGGQSYSEIYSFGSGSGNHMYGYFRVYPEASEPLIWIRKDKGGTNQYRTYTSQDGATWTDRGNDSNQPSMNSSWYGGAYATMIHNRHTGKFYHTKGSNTQVWESTNGWSWSTFSNPSIGRIFNVALGSDGSLYGLVWEVPSGQTYHSAKIYKWAASGTTPNKTLNSTPTLIKTINDLSNTPNGTNDGGVDQYSNMYPAHIYGPPFNW